MDRPGDARTFLGVGRQASPPSGPEDKDFKAAMLAEAESPWFRVRVNVWGRITGRGAVDWDAFHRRLREAQFRRFVSWREMAQSVGWAGLVPAEEEDRSDASAGLEPPPQESPARWLFGVAGYRVWLYGRSAMRHELFHAVQDFKTGLFTAKPHLLMAVAAEYSAHLWGSPLIGLPIVYGGTSLVGYGLVLLVRVALGIG